VASSRLIQTLIILFGSVLLISCQRQRGPTNTLNAYRTWQAYGGGPENMHYSALTQINRRNVSRLRVAWTYDTREAFPESEIECNPIIAGGTLYATTPKLRLIALNAATGKLIWSFVAPEQPPRGYFTIRNRGVTYWSSGDDQRIFLVVGHNLYCVDALTGKLIPSFGDSGRVDLRDGLGRNPEDISVAVTTPGIVYKDLIIMGSALSGDLGDPPGDIRAYDVHTGRVQWTFHIIPHPGELGYDTWPPNAWKYIGGGADWGGMSVDVKRSLVFVAGGTPSYTFYGADRVGNDLFANCEIALNAATGKLVWYFQAVRHDLWDRCFPAGPTLVTIKRNGRTVDGVAQITKSGYVFVFNRETGKPLFPIEYRNVGPSEVEGEKTAPTQPFPLLPPPFARQEFSPALVTDRTSAARKAVLARLRKLRYGGQFIPPTRQGTVIFPGYDGGGEWGGPAFDRTTGILYINSNEMAWILRLVPRPKTSGLANGRQVYLSNCSGCHKADLGGSPPEIPSLRDIRRKYKESQVAGIIKNGGTRMPAFTQLGETPIRAIAAYVATGRQIAAEVSWNQAERGPWLKYMDDGWNKFLDPDGYPAVKPPWGTLNAINLNTGRFVWRIPFGEFPSLAKKGISNTGSENYGGALVTEGGLLFIGATDQDDEFHAYDKTTGTLLWEMKLPAAGNATPATYEVNGRQYVVIAAGGGKWGAPSGGSYMAFALP
jgi:quinoprotein glucose dehydrogenase